MLKPRKILAFLVSTAAAGAMLFSGPPGAGAQPQEGAFDDLIDFVLRGTQEDEDGDIWTWEAEPGPSMLAREIGPPLLPLVGPTGEEPIGPDLAGPDAPREERSRRDIGETARDPFAPLGIRLGVFMIRPSIEIGVTATDNVARSDDPVATVGLVVAPEVNISSADERYQWELALGGEAIFYDRDEFNTETLSARTAWRYDLTGATSLVGRAGYRRFREEFSDPDTPGGSAERPTVDAFDATFGMEHAIGRFVVAPSGFVERAVHDDVPLIGGGVASRRALDRTEYGGRLRAGVDLGMLSPFTEIAGGRRDYDRAVDDSGFRRSSVWGELRGGVVIDRGAKLSGELLLGYRHEALEDGSLSDIDAFLVDAAILWSPRRLTEVRIDLSTDTLATSLAGQSGSVVYAGFVTIARQVTPRVQLAVGGGVEYEEAIGADWHDVTFTGVAEASYAFNRTASLAARYEYERVESTLAGGDSEAHIVGVRLRLQR